MTLPYERKRAVLSVRNLLERLQWPKLTPGVPQSIRNQAHALLKHYPTQNDMRDPRRAFGDER